MTFMKIAGAIALLVVCGTELPAAQGGNPIVWTFDRLENIGGIKTTVEGNPKVVDTPSGKAIEFDGEDDAIWIEKHPLAGAATFTFEAIFRPDGGAFEQRWFHLAERDPKTGLLASAGAVRRAGRECALPVRAAGRRQELVSRCLRQRPRLQPRADVQGQVAPDWRVVSRRTDI